MATSTNLKEKYTMEVVEKLKGISNFDNWKFCMKLILEERGLLEVVDGTLPQPAESANTSDKDEYKERNRRALILLASNVEPSQMSYIKPYKLAKDAWSELCFVYQRSALANQLFLRDQFREMKQKEGESIHDFSTRLRDTALQLDGVGAPVPEAELVLKLLEGVLPRFKMFVTALEAQSGELKFREVTTKLPHEELRRHRSDDKESAYVGKQGPKKALSLLQETRAL